jgi:sugar porter (SP) family MFS transporter
MPAAPAATGRSGRVIAVSVVAALGGFLFGFDSSVINAAVPGIQSTFGTNPAETGFVVSVALLGCALGAWYAGRIANLLGRPRTMQVAAVIFIVSAIGSAFPGNVYGLMGWRFVGGLAIGGASVLAPAYIAEIAPPALRGRLGSLQQLAIVIGIFLALLSGYAIATAAGSASNEWLLGVQAWQWMFLVEVLPAIVYLLAARTIPESPRYLVATGRVDEARGVMASMHQELTDEQVAVMREQLAGEDRQRVRDLRGPRFGLMPVVWVGIILSVLQQFVGINVIFYYSSVLWQAVGFDESNSLLISVITGATNIVATLIAIALIDRFGRRPLLLVGSIGMSVSLVSLAYLFGTAPVVEVAATSTCAAPCMQPSLTGTNADIALVAANLFVVFFGFSWGPVVWVLLGEMFPNRIRAIALSVAAAAQWAANFVVSTTFPALAATSLGLAYGIYAFFAIVSVFFVLRAVKETKGRTLEAMEAQYATT